jgi:hypothetical protein
MLLVVPLLVLLLLLHLRLQALWMTKPASLAA